MPLDMADLDGYGPAYKGGNRFRASAGNSPRGPWWRPGSRVGRVFLGLGTFVVLGGLATGVYFFKSYLERDPRFRIVGAGNIQATGLTEVSRAEMLPVFGEDIGRNIFFVNLNERRKKLEEIPWVERATVMRLLPDQIRVQVVERQPVAFARQDQQFGLVDVNGVLLTMPAATMTRHHYSFPTLSGIDPRDPPSSRKARMAVYERLMAELDSNGQKISAQISEVDLTDPEDARVTMQDDTTLLHFGDDRFLERYQRYKAHVAEWRQQYPRLAAVDLRYERQVVLEMAPGAGAAQSAVDDQAASTAENGKSQSDGPEGKAQSADKNAEKHTSGAKALSHPLGAGAKTKTPANQPSKGSQNSAAKGKNLKTTAMTAHKTAAKPKSAALKDKAAKEKVAKDKAAKDKTRAAAQRTALNSTKHKPAHPTRPTPAEGQ
ncbi:MAG: FtsQ-type POTRA domain-containing protein [Terracidiphilus sp.]